MPPPARAIWESIQDTPTLDHEQIAGTWVYEIGAPKPTSAISQATTTGRVRIVSLRRGARFEQQFLEWQPYRHARWRYCFMPDSFPPDTLDEHVRIGGHYFGLLEGDLQLQPHGAMTEVTLRIRYRVSTEFNWYAAPLARLPMGNLEESITVVGCSHPDSTSQALSAARSSGEQIAVSGTTWTAVPLQGAA